jgi:hypothetical protein
MKKIILASLTVLAFAILTTINFSLNTKNNDKHSSLLLRNTEALSDNAEGTKPYTYSHLEGKPKKCTLHKQVSINGTIEYTSTAASLGAGWYVVTVSGIEEICPKTGKGCTVYSCRQTPE